MAKFGYSPYMYESRRKCKNCNREWRWHDTDDCVDENNIRTGTKFELARKNKPRVSAGDNR